MNSWEAKEKKEEQYRIVGLKMSLFVIKRDNNGRAAVLHKRR